MPTLKCLSCDFEATTRTSNELLEKLTEHAAAHHVPSLPDAVINNVRQAMGSPAVATSRKRGVVPSSGGHFR